MEAGKNIKQLREKLGLSQEELALRMGYKDKSSISKIEIGKTDLSQARVKAFADFFNVTPTFLMGLENHLNVPDPNWKPTITPKDEINIERELEAILDGTSEEGHFLSYGGKAPSEMSEVEFEDHILFKNALRETLRIAKRINKEKHTPNKYRKGSR